MNKNTMNCVTFVFLLFLKSLLLINRRISALPSSYHSQKILSHSFGKVSGIAVDSQDRIYVGDAQDCIIYLVDDLAGTSTPLAGTSSVCDLAATINTESPLSSPIGSPRTMFMDLVDILYFVSVVSIDSLTKFNIMKCEQQSNKVTILVQAEDSIQALWVDTVGNIFFTQATRHVVMRYNSTSKTSAIFAGVLDFPGYNSIPVPAASTGLRSPSGVWGDSSRRVYIADTGNCVIRRVGTGLSIALTAGEAGMCEYNGEFQDKPSFANPQTFWGNLDTLFVVDSGSNRIRAINRANNQVSTIVITDASTQLGAEEQLQIVGDRYNNIFYAIPNAQNITKLEFKPVINPQQFAIEKVAGVGTKYTGDEQLATIAWLDQPTAVWESSDAAIFICDTGHNRIRRVDPISKVITTVVGNGERGYSGDDDEAKFASIFPCTGLFGDDYNLYFTDPENCVIRAYSFDNQHVNTVVGQKGHCSFGGEGDTVRNPTVLLNKPNGLCGSGGNSMFIADTDNHVIRMVTGTDGDYDAMTIYTAAGTVGTSGTLSDSNALHYPFSVSYHGGQMFIADTMNFAIRSSVPNSNILATIYFDPAIPNNAIQILAVDTAGLVAFYRNSTNTVEVLQTPSATAPVTKTIAGGGNIDSRSQWHGGALVNARTAELAETKGMFFGSNGLYLSDTANGYLRLISVPDTIGNRTISIVAGSDKQFAGDSGSPDMAVFSSPMGLWVDTSDNVFIADCDNLRIRKVLTTERLVTTVAGNGMHSAMQGVATASGMTCALHLCGFSGADSVLYYVEALAGHASNKVIKIDLITGLAERVAGGAAIYDSANTVATSANLPGINGLFADSVNRIYLSDKTRGTILRITLDTGIMELIGGGAGLVNLGNNIPATSSAIYPGALWASSDSDLYFIDYATSLIRFVDSNLIVTTMAGGGKCCNFFSEAPALEAYLGQPNSIWGDSEANVYITNTQGSTIQKIDKQANMAYVIAGCGTTDDSAKDTDIGTAACLNQPVGIAGTINGEVFFSDSGSNLVRKLVPWAATESPSQEPTIAPSAEPSVDPTFSPSAAPSISPSAEPSVTPSVVPSATPTITPSEVPSAMPSIVPSAVPSETPSAIPSATPSVMPSATPTIEPTPSPSVVPTIEPSPTPSITPTGAPSCVPSIVPSIVPSSAPSAEPTQTPSETPSSEPSIAPSVSPSLLPSMEPSTVPSVVPSATPSVVPSAEPTALPSVTPSIIPSNSPSTTPSDPPTEIPTQLPSEVPTETPSVAPSAFPSAEPTTAPSQSPTVPPSTDPSAAPSLTPTVVPSVEPSLVPSSEPSISPSLIPSEHPSAPPTPEPSRTPTLTPSAAPSTVPTIHPSIEPTASPSVAPTISHTASPSQHPTASPSCLPTITPSAAPSAVPSTAQPSAVPSRSPTTTTPSQTPTVRPSRPTPQPTVYPTIVSAGFFPTSRAIAVSGVADAGQFKIVLPYFMVSSVVGDGFTDVTLDVSAEHNSSMFVVHGSAHMGRVIDLQSTSPEQGYSIAPAVIYDYSGRSVSNVGDINGDRYDDLIIGVPYAARCYVLFGTPQGFVNMTQGFTIFGSETADLTGWSVSGAGDVNNDTFADIVIGAPGAAHDGVFSTGAVYVLYGSARVFANIQLSSLHSSEGFAVYGASRQDQIGIAVSAAGDVNSDGFDDVLFGAAVELSFLSGAAYVLLGQRANRPASSTVSILQTQAQQIVKFSAPAWSLCGYSVCNAGDVNGDGFDDVLVGCAPRAGSALLRDTSYVVFGNRTLPATINLKLLSAFQGVVISGGGRFVSSVKVSESVSSSTVDLVIGGQLEANGAGFAIILPTALIAPTVSPSAAPTTIAPTAAPVVTQQPSLAPTTTTPSSSPTTLKPSFEPTMQPSQPTVEPSLMPTGPSVLPSESPTAPTESPSESPTLSTLSPSASPTTPIPSTEPSVSPSEAPTTSPTVQPSTQSPSTAVPSIQLTTALLRTRFPSQMPTPAVVLNTTTVEITSGGEYRIVRNLTNTNYHINVSAHSSVDFITQSSTENSFARLSFTVVPQHDVTVTIDQFNQQIDILDLSAFSQLHLFSDLNITSGSVLVHLPNRYLVRLSNRQPSDMSERNFLFATPANSTETSQSDKKSSNAALIGIIAAASFVGILLFFLAGPTYDGVIGCMNEFKLWRKTQKLKYNMPMYMYSLPANKSTATGENNNVELWNDVAEQGSEQNNSDNSSNSNSDDSLRTVSSKNSATDDVDGDVISIRNVHSIMRAYKGNTASHTTNKKENDYDGKLLNVTNEIPRAAGEGYRQQGENKSDDESTDYSMPSPSSSMFDTDSSDDNNDSECHTPVNNFSTVANNFNNSVYSGNNRNQLDQYSAYTSQLPISTVSSIISFNASPPPLLSSTAVVSDGESSNEYDQEYPIYTE